MLSNLRLALNGFLNGLPEQLNEPAGQPQTIRRLAAGAEFQNEPVLFRRVPAIDLLQLVGQPPLLGKTYLGADSTNLRNRNKQFYPRSRRLAAWIVRWAPIGMAIRKHVR